MATETDTLRVFISYARKDASAFAEELKAGLEAAGFDAFFDREDIAVAEDWEDRLNDLIRKADTVVYVLTPASVESPRCGWEVERARELSKRLIPVVAIDVPEEQTPAPLRRLQYVFFSGGRPFGVALRELTQALRTDLTWVREHTRLAELATQWRAKGRPDELLLRGQQIDDATTWVARWRAPAPEITDLQRQYVAASEHAATASVVVERARLERMARVNRRWTGFAAVLSVVGVLAVCGAAYLWWTNDQMLAVLRYNGGRLDAQAQELKMREEKAARLEAELLGQQAEMETLAAQLAKLKGGWKTAIFWCAGPGADANRSRAERIAQILGDERKRQDAEWITGAPGTLTVALGAVTVAVLSEDLNNTSSYLLNADVIRADSSLLERGAAQQIISFVAEKGGPTLTLGTTETRTEFYLSVFLCRGSAPAPTGSGARTGG